ncbi:RNA 2',3'-cyclic phosphodiesterase [Nocardioides sp. CFH 31398]|uniref:RNA 2',3'-cyclic phosphodiesterase n=1 Tax=Nocardioides sp. CFH 31398 TaxID=2919579 RepID=UPI001F05CE57|nr:RNA 2',3'-cyclic phosphodiesterase [Nocardioides sp. CFH 31398]MCH1865393.1 RNA 2',3'-cyclic phosphodiesterase [Nocardioides sp. CFH 31398]
MRIFVALRPAPEVVEHLATFLEPRRDAAPSTGWRWTPVEQWHLTLAFCGDVDDWRVEDLVERVGEAASRRAPLDLRVDGGGAFPHADGAKVLWGDLAGDRAGLDDLAAACRRACSRAGAVVDGDRFRPHLTLARLGRPSQVSDWVKLLDAYAGPDWRADEVEVVASHLGEGPRRGARHEVVATLPLDGAAA